jgi:hypothetical protein
MKWWWGINIIAEILPIKYNRWNVNKKIKGEYWNESPNITAWRGKFPQSRKDSRDRKIKYSPQVQHGIHEWKWWNRISNRWRRRRSKIMRWGIQVVGESRINIHIEWIGPENRWYDISSPIEGRSTNIGEGRRNIIISIHCWKVIRNNRWRRREIGDRKYNRVRKYGIEHWNGRWIGREIIQSPSGWRWGRIEPKYYSIAMATNRWRKLIINHNTKSPQWWGGWSWIDIMMMMIVNGNRGENW